MVNVYAWNYHRIFLIMLFLLILWRILARYIRIDIWKILNLFGAGVSFFLILKFTVLGRTPSGVHQFVVMAPYSDEFFRELLMNVFLYFPLGLTLGELIGWHRIWLALVLAIVIESWQYAAGTGMVQVTDVICNTLGAWIGGIAFQKRKHCL